MKKENYKYIVIILTYRNTEDLLECIESIKNKIDSVKIIIVNSYYDEETKNEIEKTANERKCDFINIVNKGYSYGNNRGIEYALDKYIFDYIIISNPDIVVEQFGELSELDAEIIAPKIIAASGKKQNPMLVKENHFSEYCIYCGLKKNNKIILGVGIVFNRVINRIETLRKKGKFDIFAAHGSFVIIKKVVVQTIKPLYDENVFLFGEEGILAYRCRMNGFKTVYNNDIIIKHKEDGCMKLADFSINNELKKANIYFYENYVLKNK